MSNERELEAGIEWYENADWGNEDYKEGVVRGFQAGAEWQRSQHSAPAGYVMVPVEPTDKMLDELCLVGSFARHALVERYSAMLAALRADIQGEHACLYECTNCGGMYLEKVSQCDCMPDVQQFNEWIAYPKQAGAALRAQEPVATVTIQHFRQDPRMENVDFQLQVTLPQGTHKLYASPRHKGSGDAGCSCATGRNTFTDSAA